MEAGVIVSRVFNTSAENLWRLWTDPALLMNWWGPDRFTCPLANIDFREGRVTLVSMKAPPEFGGAEHFSIWAYTGIVPLQRIEFIQNLANGNGVRQKPTDVGMPPDFPEDVQTVVTFSVIKPDETEMTVMEFADFGQIAHFAQLGMEQCFGKMEKIFAGA